MLEKLLLALVVIEFVNAIHNISKSVIDAISTRNLTKTQQEAVEGQQQTIKLQEEQFKLNKLYSEKQDKQNASIEQLAYLFTAHDSRLNELEKKLAKRPVTKKNKETK